ncbi:MAG: CoA transferase [Rhodopseudomonas palustris]|nr:CoA transferase [Rhodopseudomonas palustris]
MTSAPVVAAPFAATVLGDYGAEVIKIEPPTVPDAIRYWAVIDDRYQPFWLAASRNKLPITLNLKHPEGRKILAALVARSDVLLENMRPGTLDRLGFSASALWEINRGPYHRSDLGLRPDRPLRRQAGVRHAGRGHERLHPHERPSGRPAHEPSPRPGRHDCRSPPGAGRDHGAPRSEAGERGGQELDLSLYEPLFNFMAADFLTYSPLRRRPAAHGQRGALHRHPGTATGPATTSGSRFPPASQAPFERLMDLVGCPDLKTAAGFRNNQERPGFGEPPRLEPDHR